MKAKRVAVFALLVTLAVSTVACGGNGDRQQMTETPEPTLEVTPTPTPSPTPTPIPTPTTEGDYQSYSGDSFSISYPTEWEILPQFLVDEMMPQFGLEAESVWGTLYQSSDFQCQVVGLVMSQALDMELSLDSYDWMAMVGMPPTDRTEAAVSGLPAYRHEVSMEGMQALFHTLVDGTTGWIIMLMTPILCYDRYEAIFETTVDSFRLLD